MTSTPYAVSWGNFPGAAPLLEALREKNMAPSAVKIGYMLPNEAAAAFATGQIEAWATFGTYQARAEADGARIIRDGTGIGPGYSAITVSDHALADPAKRQAIADFLSRARDANRWCEEHPEDYARLYARETGLDIAIARVIAWRERPGLYAPDAAFVTALQAAVDRFHATYKVLPRRVDVASLVVPDLLRG